MNRKVLVTGGAGYIGSHTVIALIERGYEVVVLDDLSTGSAEMIHPKADFIHGKAGDTALLNIMLSGMHIDAVLHFAGSIIVPDSIIDPVGYYDNNTVTSLNLIRSCIGCGVDNIVFSSTAAVYGIPQQLPVVEDLDKNPINPYGRSKLMTEMMLGDAAVAHGIKYAALRYFNVAGADPLGRAGQVNPKATALIKVACQVATGKRPILDIFGDDFDTPDGTGVRDFIHVSDLANAHVLALEYLLERRESLVVNCGYGHGISVKQVVHACEELTKRSLPVRVQPRRAGDPANVFSDNSLIRSLLQWKPKHDDIMEIVGSALAWEQRTK